MMPITIDVEASGFGRGSYPLEIGVALPDRTRHCFLISRLPDWTHWDDSAERIHGISRDVLLHHGRPVPEVAGHLNQLLQGGIAYSDAWSFDMSWVGKLFDAADMLQAFRISAIQDLLDEHQRELWDVSKREVICDLGLRRHRASGDARIVQETWVRVTGEQLSGQITA